MGLLDRLMRRKATEGDEQGTEVATEPCLHTALGPRWDSADDMGNESKANSYRLRGVWGVVHPRAGRADPHRGGRAFEG